MQRLDIQNIVFDEKTVQNRTGVIKWIQTDYIIALLIKDTKIILA